MIFTMMNLWWRGLISLLLPTWCHLGAIAVVAVAAADGTNIDTTQSHSWQFAQKIQNDQPLADARLGSAVALDGDVLVVGVPRWRTGNSYRNQNFLGAAIFYRLRQENDHHDDLHKSDKYFVQTNVFLPDHDHRPSGHEMGAAVAVQGSWAASGAPGEGAVYVFHWNSRHDHHKRWSFHTKLSSASFPGGSFGASVHLEVWSTDRPTIVVGAPDTAQYRGAFYVFELDDDEQWILSFAQTGVESERLGEDVVLRDRTLAVAAVNYYQQRGLVRLYQPATTNASVWEPSQILEPPSKGAASLFGTSLALNNNHIAVGTGDGDIYLYEWQDGDLWWHTQTIPSPTVPPIAVAVSLDRGVLVVGAGQDDMHGWQAGGVWMYALEDDKDQNSTWRLQQTLEPPGGPVPFSFFGTDVAVQGGTVVVGAPRMDHGSSGLQEGGVFVFEEQLPEGQDDA